MFWGNNLMSFFNRILVCIFVFSLPAFAGPSVQRIHNFYKVDNHVYRGGQPKSEGFQYLAKIGVKTVLDLREPGRRSAEEEREVTALGMKYVNVPMTGLTPPTESEITKILGMLEDDSTGAVFVHCMRGADRTGAVLGAYRVDHDHWDNTRALQEAKADGMGFFQLPRANFIRHFQARTVEAKNANKPQGTKLPAATAPAVALPTPVVVR